MRVFVRIEVFNALAGCLLVVDIVTFTDYGMIDGSFAVSLKQHFVKLNILCRYKCFISLYHLIDIPLFFAHNSEKMTKLSKGFSVSCCFAICVSR